MKKITKILLPTDLSEFSLGAIEYGCQLASRSRAHIYLIHIIYKCSSTTDSRLETGRKSTELYIYAAART